ncbi:MULTISPECIES: sodium:solute symporter [unclassified Arenibacter]|uniref:sodium:solute symporter n=1 Tax=unclassified Arenibacter TaxID=2615047 RepID=UPI000E35059A|nr:MULTISPECIES: sodium:solute symporter [unclassified Arenibacter]MCM4164703.1 sodium:glucose symporter [Arenibacter sp. A80]RFT55778.1 sodium:glucose symporter [Arenibacter sp. P308M17]
MNYIDLIIIVSYLVGILALGIFSSRSKKMTSDNYFLAGRSLNWVIIGAALFASNISTIHLVGLAASGFEDGLVWGNFEWMASIVLILLGLIFAPFYFKSKISTLPEFLEKRYSSPSRSFLAFMAILGALFVHIGMSLYAGAIVFKSFFGIDVFVSIVIISVITATYTILGGLRAVVITETVQTVVLIIGAVILTIFAIKALPEVGVNNLTDFKNSVRPDQLSMLRSGDNAGNSGLSWYAIFLGYPILGLWYWCSDQTIVQRVLAAKSEDDAQKGPIFAGFLKILPVFIMVLPGVLGYVLFKDKITNSNETLPVLISELLPIGIKGIFAAALLSALMSTIAAALNSCSTLVAIDIAKRIKPSLSDKKQVRIGKYVAVIVMILAIAWSTQGGRFNSIFEAINKIAAALAPPIATVFLFGVFSKRGTKEASLITLIFGFIIGISAFAADFIPTLYGKPSIITDTWGIPFMMQAWWLFCICSVVYFIVSYLTPEPTIKQLQYTWDNPWQFLTDKKFKGVQDVRFYAGALLALIVILYSIFQ